MEPSYVYIIDDDQDLLDFLQVSMTTNTLIVATYASAQEFLDTIDSVNSKGCVVLDVNMPDMNGLELQSKLNEIRFTLPIIFLTAHAEVPLAVQAMQAGAVNFMEKPVQPSELLETINKVLSTPVMARPSQDEVDNVRQTVDNLTPREREVMDLIVKGASNKEAAQILDISPRTVEIYRATVMRKMDCSNLPELVRKAISIGM